MSCYFPLTGIYKGDRTDSGKKKFLIEGPMDPRDVSVLWPGSVQIPCGRCIGCRLDYSRSWADRMMLELEDHESAIFVTLTYDNDHMTWCKFGDHGEPLLGTLVVRDCQLFLKRLRKAYPDRRIRFYLAGEYGPSTFRPHYHAILFGLSLADFPDLVDHGCNELGQSYYVSSDFARIWSNGFCLLSGVTWKTCAYVARYCTKKLSGEMEYERFRLTGQLRPFALMSRKPGIGYNYLSAHPDCLDYQNINLSTPEGGLQIRIPKYFEKQLERLPSKNFPNPLYNPERYAILKNERRNFSADSMLLKLAQTDLSYLELLEAEENKKIGQTRSLKRDIV